jgi:hypothetical protein
MHSLDATVVLRGDDESLTLGLYPYMGATTRNGEVISSGLSQFAGSVEDAERKAAGRVEGSPTPRSEYRYDEKAPNSQGH